MRGVLSLPCIESVELWGLGGFVRDFDKECGFCFHVQLVASSVPVPSSCPSSRSCL